MTPFEVISVWIIQVVASAVAGGAVNTEDYVIICLRIPIGSRFRSYYVWNWRESQKFLLYNYKSDQQQHHSVKTIIKTLRINKEILLLIDSLCLC